MRWRRRKGAQEPQPAAGRRAGKEERRSPLKLVIGTLVIGLVVLASAVYAFSYTTKLRLTVAGNLRRQVADLRMSYLGIHSVTVPVSSTMRVPPGFYRMEERLQSNDVRTATPLCVISPKIGHWITIGPNDTFRLTVRVHRCPKGK